MSVPRRTHKPIVWAVSLVRRFCPQEGLGTELIISTPIGNGFLAIELNGESPDAVAADRICEAISRTPWISQPHEVHSHDAELVSRIRRRLAALGIRAAAIGPAVSLDEHRVSLERERGVILRWLHAPTKSIRGLKKVA